MSSDNQDAGITPSAGVCHDLLTLVRMCQIIGDRDKELLQKKAASCPEISIQRLLVEGGYMREATVDSLELGQLLIAQGLIKETQFCVGMYDEMTTGIRMKDSLKTRGWL
jgi:hypothetical protein